MVVKLSTRNSAAKMAEHLIDVLSDTYLLAIKTHGYHWNVTGPLFPQLHVMFGDQYAALFEAADEVAERIRALDFPAPGGPEAFRENTVVKEASSQPLTASAMVKDLLKTHEAVRGRIEEARAFAEEVEDRATEDMMIGRLEAHDKTIWMLKVQVS
jgi:starvation-inducible DNA-binding protein